MFWTVMCLKLVRKKQVSEVSKKYSSNWQSFDGSNALGVYCSIKHLQFQVQGSSTITWYVCMRFNEWTVMCVSSNDAQVWTITSVCTVYNVWMHKYKCIQWCEMWSSDLHTLWYTVVAVLGMSRLWLFWKFIAASVSGYITSLTAESQSFFCDVWRIFVHDFLYSKMMKIWW